MMSPAGQDVPVLRGTFAIRSPRSILLLTPDVLLLALAIWILSVTFIFWPAALEHAPISFERRGVVHHVWHYLLLVGSSMTLWGLMATSRFRLKVELIGLCVTVGMLGVTLSAMVSSAVLDGAALDGLHVGLLATCIGMLMVRAWTVARQPLVQLASNEMPGHR